MKKYKKSWRLLPIVRAIAVLSAVGVITTAVTFAALQSSGNALTGNTISTATAALKISKDGSAYSDSVPGYNFTGLVPGGAAQPTNGYAAWLQNVGTATLSLSLSVPTAPTVSGTVDLQKVSVIIIPNTGVTQTIPLSDLIAGKVALANSNLAINATTLYHVQVSMAADAVSGSSASITNLDLSFSGTPL